MRRLAGAKPMTRATRVPIEFPARVALGPPDWAQPSAHLLVQGAELALPTQKDFEDEAGARFSVHERRIVECGLRLD